jgi:hypothetical protein
MTNKCYNLKEAFLQTSVVLSDSTMLINSEPTIPIQTTNMPMTTTNLVSTFKEESYQKGIKTISPSYISVSVDNILKESTDINKGVEIMLNKLGITSNNYDSKQIGNTLFIYIKSNTTENFFQNDGTTTSANQSQEIKEIIIDIENRPELKDTILKYNMPKTAAYSNMCPSGTYWSCSRYGICMCRKKPNLVIIGSIVGGIIALIIIGLLVWYLLYRFYFKNRSSTGSIASGPIAPGQGYFYPGNSSNI